LLHFSTCLNLARISWVLCLFVTDLFLDESHGLHSTARAGRFASVIRQTIHATAKAIRCAELTAMTAPARDHVCDHKAPRRIFMGSESHAHTARLEMRKSIAAHDALLAGASA
jgi:hypothetical protein